MQFKRSKSKTTEQRFYERVNKTETCWLWIGRIMSSGYGRMPSGNHYLAHRFSYELHKGPIPEGMFVCHHCDNPSCVNPEHLFLGTQKDNMQDCVRKGRSLKGRHFGPHSQEHRAKQSATNKIILNKPEMKAKISSGLIRMYADKREECI